MILSGIKITVMSNNMQTLADVLQKRCSIKTLVPVSLFNKVQVYSCDFFKNMLSTEHRQVTA